MNRIWHAPGRIWAAMMAAGTLRLWLQAGASMASTLLLVGYGLVIWKGPWPHELAGRQLDLLGQGHLMAGLLALVGLVCITGTRVGLKASRQGLDANVDQDDHQPAVVTTTTTQVVPAAAPKPSEDEGNARPV